MKSDNLLILGIAGCDHCISLKRELTENGTKFEYKDFNSLSDEDQDHYLNLASNAGVKQFPIIIKNNQVLESKDMI